MNEKSFINLYFVLKSIEFLKILLQVYYYSGLTDTEIQLYAQSERVQEKCIKVS